MIAYFERFDITMTTAQARSASHQGRCDEDVQALSKEPDIADQLALLDPVAVRNELDEYGAWNPEELSDHAQNLQRILWIACGLVIDYSTEAV